MNTQKVLTISIAAYNVESYIEKTLQSLISTSALNELEVIVVDDGSKDSTRDIVGKYVEKYPDSFKIISKQNGGWGSTVNCGLANATGRYFKLLDGDDYFDRIEDLIKVLCNTDADLVYTPYVAIYEDGTYEIHDAINRFNGKGEIPINEFNGNIEYSMHSCAFKTECIQNKINITEHCFYTDVEFVLKSIKYVKSVLVCSDLPVYWYRLGRLGQSVSREGYIKHFDEHVKVLNTLLKDYRCLNNDCMCRHIFVSRILDLVDQQYYLYLILKGNMTNASRLKEFDTFIKNNYPEFYTTDRSRVKMFRRLGRISYPLIVYR